jgi:hypothetical protein
LTLLWQAFRLSGQDALAVRASKKLRSDELLVTSFSGTRLPSLRQFHGYRLTLEAASL